MRLCKKDIPWCTFTVEDIQAGALQSLPSSARSGRRFAAWRQSAHGSSGAGRYRGTKRNIDRHQAGRPKSGACPGVHPASGPRAGFTCRRCLSRNLVAESLSTPVRRGDGIDVSFLFVMASDQCGNHERPFAPQAQLHRLGPHDRASPLCCSACDKPYQDLRASPARIAR